MQKRTILSVTLITALLVAAFLLLNSAAPVTPVEKKETPAAPTCCKEKTKECVENKVNSSGDMIIDNLSRQFISIPVFSN
jgi:hypothetical protein